MRVSGSRLADRLLEALHHHATTAVLTADLLPAAGNGKVASASAVWDPKQACQVLHPAEEGALVVDAAAAGAGVVVDAPAIGPHHLQILLLLFGAEGLDRLIALARDRAGSKNRNR